MDLALDAVYGAFIDNQFVVRPGAETFAATDPATGAHLADLVRGTAEDVEAAVTAARRAFPAWAATTAEERSRLLNKLADALEADMPRHARIDAHDIGRRLYETTYDQMVAIGQYRYFAGAILTFEGLSRSLPNGLFATRHEPLGVCALVVPWNVPTIMAACKIAPALAAGNTVVLKPDENASLSTLELAKKIAAIFPPGVVNVVPGFGPEAGQALIHHPGVRKISFTGSTEVGRLMAQAGADALLPVTLELGGKSPNIVFPDIENIDAVVDNAAFAAMYCNGQSCLAGTRLFLHDAIFDEFIDRLTAKLSTARIGGQFEENVTLTCLVSGKQGQRVMDYIEQGKTEAKLLHGGGRAQVAGHDHGWFIEPTVFEATNDMRISREEIFGPVLSVIRWNDYETMIAQANDSDYGLASGIYTSAIGKALETAKRLEAGSVWVNQYFNLGSGTPFGGYKQSGLGREFSHETLKAFSQVKSIALAAEVPPPFYIA